MAKLRRKVQKEGLWDEDVSNPNHDNICLWAHRNADAILRLVYPELFDRGWVELDIQQLSKLDIEGSVLEEAKDTFLRANSRPNPKVTRKILEFVLEVRPDYGHRQGAARTIGFADLLIHWSRPQVVPKFTRESSRGVWPFEGLEIIWCGDSREVRPILVEAKTEIRSVGELIRQLRHYQTAFTGPMVVVCPDADYEEILKEQGFGFLQYPASQIAPGGSLTGPQAQFGNFSTE